MAGCRRGSGDQGPMASPSLTRDWRPRPMAAGESCEASAQFAKRAKGLVQRIMSHEWSSTKSCPRPTWQLLPIHAFSSESEAFSIIETGRPLLQRACVQRHAKLRPRPCYLRARVRCFATDCANEKHTKLRISDANGHLRDGPVCQGFPNKTHAFLSGEFAPATRWRPRGTGQEDPAA